MEQVRQCTCWGAIVSPLLLWKNSKHYIFLVCVRRLCCLYVKPCVLCHLWPVGLHNIFQHYVINGKFFPKNVFKYIMSVLICYRAFPETFPILRIIQQHTVWNADIKYPHYCQSVIKLAINFVYFLKTQKFRTPLQSAQCKPNYFMQTHRHTQSS
jgi:hypothetical protein